MFFYVYFDPKVIKDAQEKGDYALKYLHDILKGFTVNCALLTFEDHHQIEELGNYIKTLPQTFEITELKALLTFLQKNNRFIYCLIPDYIGVKNDTKCLYEQYENKELDLIFLNIEEYNNYEWNIEHACLNSYNQSKFERRRFEFARNGKALIDDEYEELQLLNTFLKKLLLNARQIEICDYSFGLNFRNDYIYSWKVFIHWLNDVIIPIDKIKLFIHCDKNRDPGRVDFMLSELRRQLPNPLIKLEIFVKFYIPQNTNIALPHEHYIYTDQFAIDFGRGMDFIKQSNRKNRNTTFSYMNKKEVGDKVESCKHLLDNPTEILIH